MQSILHVSAALLRAEFAILLLTALRALLVFISIKIHALMTPQFAKTMAITWQEAYATLAFSPAPHAGLVLQIAPPVSTATSSHHLITAS